MVLGVNLRGEKEVLGLVVDRERRGEVLAVGADRVEASRRAGHLHRQHGWFEGAA